MKTIPTLPVERFAERVSCDFDGYRLTAQRKGNPDRAMDMPDTIIVSVMARGGCADIYLAPAMLVHMANELLTDNERAQIRFAPALAGGATE